MFTKMTNQHAKTISAWTYEGDCACYSMSQDAAAVDELMNGSYYAALDADGSVFGFVCFGESARIPTVEVGAYDESALDIGLGLAPPLCGRGLGFGFMKDCLRFAAAHFAPETYRLSVAAFNARAIKVYERIGFSKVCQVTHAHTTRRFVIMRLPASDVDLPD